MEYKQIETFMKVVACQNITKAAELLYITQSTASYRLRSLEDELGTTLILRRKGTQVITLTPQGHNFVPIAREWMRVYQMTRRFCRDSHLLNIRIAAPESLHRYFRSTYQCIRQKEKDLRLTILTSNSDQIVPMLEQRRADIGFSYLPFEGRELDVMPVGSFHLAVAQCGGELPSGSVIDPTTLDPKKCIILKGLGYENPYTAACLHRWFPESQDYAITLDSHAVLESSMADGEWTLVPEQGFVSLDKERSDIHTYLLPESQEEFPFYQVTPQHMDDRVESFLKNYF